MRTSHACVALLSLVIGWFGDYGLGMDLEVDEEKLKVLRRGENTKLSGERNGLGADRIALGVYTNGVHEHGRGLGKPAELYVTKGPILSKDKLMMHFSVEWKNVVYTSKHDWIGVYPCKSIDSSESCSPVGHYPVQFKDIKGKMKNKTVNFSVWVRPGVQGYRFAYVASTVLPYPEVLTMTKVIPVPTSALFLPMQVRTSLVEDDPSAVRVVWSQSPWSVPDVNDVKRFRVRFGETSRDYTIVAEPEQVFNYEASDMCEKDMMPSSSIGWIRPGLQVEAIVRGLKPQTKYFYAIEDLHSNALSQERVYLSGPGVGQRTKIAIFGDMGQSMEGIDNSKQHSWDFGGRGEISSVNTSRLVEHLVDNHGVTLISHIGDLSYATGSLGLWDAWLNMIQPISSKVPYMTAIGNHEMGWKDSFVPGTDSQGECGRPYCAFFPFASQEYTRGDGKLENISKARGWNMPYYSFDHGLVHVTVMSTEHNFTEGSTQLEWIRKDLASVNRDITPWLVFVGHRPMYISSTFAGDHDIVSFSLQKYIEPVLLENHVDLAFWGHHHSYQRTCRFLSENSCSNVGHGVQHIVVGSAGFSFSKLAKEKDPKFMFTNNNTWGISLVDFVNATWCRISFVENANGSIVDDAWVQRFQPDPLVSIA